MIAGCYARKSTEQNVADDAKSVTRQVERARAYATKKGWRFSDDLVFVDDAVSGGEFKNRPGLTRLLETIKGKHKLNVLIVSEQSRLGRDTVRVLTLIQALGDADVKIFSYLEDREISLDDEMAEVEQFMKSWAGSSERRKAGQRVRDKMRQLAEQGKYTGGRLFGYMVENGQRVIKPSEASIIRKIFKRRADGAGYFKIARELEREGIASPRGGKDWSPTQVGLLLTNEMYNGTIVYSRTRQTKKRGTLTTEKSPEAIIRTDVPALRIITPERWEAVQRVNVAATAGTWRASDGRLKSRPTESKHLLTPFLSCGTCGGSFYVRTDNGKEYLHCTNRHHFGKLKCTNGHRLSVALAEKAITQTFETALCGNIVMTKLAEVLEAHRLAQQDPAPSRPRPRSCARRSPASLTRRPVVTLTRFMPPSAPARTGWPRSRNS
jgi:site-specific DNA recombinase